MPLVTLNKALQVPDSYKVERCRRLPSFGPRILFFTGGSALAEFSKNLIAYTHNSVHLCTPFDSGGSSAEIRKHFNMLAVGDLRHRLLSLADQSLQGNQEVFQLFATRFRPNSDPQYLKAELDSLVQGRHPLMRAVPDPLRKIIRNHLGYFQQAMPDSFQLAGASLGNLILVGGYLNNRRQIDPVLYLLSRLVETRGIVRPTSSSDLQLRATLQDGAVVVGQHNLTGKEQPRLSSPIRHLELVNEKEQVKRPKLKTKVGEFIQQAELIVYPMGSFFSSLCANFLIQGVADAIAKNPAPKVYVPNLGHDPEQLGYDLPHLVEKLLDILAQNSSAKAPGNPFLNYLLLDLSQGQYAGLQDLPRLERHGIQVLDLDLVSPDTQQIDPEKLIAALLSLV